MPKITYKELISKETFCKYLNEHWQGDKSQCEEIYCRIVSVLSMTLKQFTSQLSELATTAEIPLENLMHDTFSHVSHLLDHIYSGHSADFKDVLLKLSNSLLVDLRELSLLAINAWLNFYCHEFWLFYELGVNQFSLYPVYVLERISVVLPKFKWLATLQHPGDGKECLDCCLSQLVHRVGWSDAVGPGPVHGGAVLQEQARADR